MDLADELIKLDGLRKAGAISEGEYEEAKASALAKSQTPGAKIRGTVDQLAADENMWGMFIHLSQFLGYVVPVAGWVVPLVLWQIKKADSEVIDRHGRIVANWILTEFILGIIFVLLSVVLIGIPLMIVLVIVAVIFPIVGAIKANSGEIWSYPCSIKFFGE